MSNSLIFPVFCVIFPDFSSLFKIPWLFPDWKMPSHFSRFSSLSGNPDLDQFTVWINLVRIYLKAVINTQF